MRERAQRTYLVKFGSHFLLPTAFEGTEEVSEEREEQLARELHDYLLQRIRDAPNCTRVVRQGDPCINWMFGMPVQEHRRGFALLEPIIFEIFWPYKNWADAELFEGKLSEHLLVAYDGATFALVAPLSAPAPFEWSFDAGRQAMKILKAILEPSDHWVSALLGPTPMWPTIYFLFAPEDQVHPFGVQLVGKDDVLVRSALTSDEDCKDLVLQAVEEAHWGVVTHYLAMIARSGIIHAELEMNGRLESAASAQKEMLSCSTWNAAQLLKRGALVHRLREALAGIYESYVRFAEEKAALRSSLREARDSFTAVRFLSPVADYTAEHVKDVTEDDYTYALQAAKFYEEETRSVLMQWATVRAALVGGLLVLAATAVILWLS